MHGQKNIKLLRVFLNILFGKLKIIDHVQDDGRAECYISTCLTFKPHVTFLAQ